MSSKRAIQTYTTLDRRIKRFRQRLGLTIPVTSPFKAANLTGFVTFEGKWNTEYPQMKSADSLRQAATALVITSTAELYMFCSHYLQVMFLAMKRGEIPYSALPLYGIPVSNEPKLPDMSSEAKLLQVALDIISGDAARLLAGGVAMSNPTVAQVNTKLTAYNALQLSQSEAKENYRIELTDVVNLFLEGVEVMRKLYVDIEYFYDDQTQEFINDILREWGMEFYNGPGETTVVTVTVPGMSTVVVPGVVIADTNVIVATMNTPGGTGSLCKNIAGCEAGGKPLVYNAPLTINAPDLSGEDDQLAVTNTGAEAIEVELKVVG